MLDDLILTLVKYLLTVIFVIFTVFFGFRIFDRFTHSLDEWKEIKKGNMAISLFYCSIIFSIFIIIFPLMQMLITAIISFKLLTSVLLLIVYLLALPFIVLTLYLILNLCDKLTLDLDELSELKKGNMGIALLLSLIILICSFALSWASEPFLLLIKKVIF